MKEVEELGNIIDDAKKELKGFKLFGIFPFYVNYIGFRTHIKLCVIKEKIQSLSKEPSNADFDNSELQKQLYPLMVNYITTALINKRPLYYIFKPFVKYKVSQSSHASILNMYINITKLDDPSFFLLYWKLILRKDNTILKVDEPFTGESKVTKKEQGKA